MRILIVEDNRDIAENIADYLEPLGHELDFAGDGNKGLHLAVTRRFDVIVLDLNLPGLDGITLCHRLRTEARVMTPVLMLTARDQLDDKLAGFRAGTDDYLVKPFSLKELDVRLQALVKRNRGSSRVLGVADLEYDPDTLIAQRAGKPLELNPIQRKLLELLLRNTHRVVAREELEHLVWGETVPDKDLLRTHIYNLRHSIDKGFDTKLLHTIHGSGYRLHDSSPPV
jgi:DNA-binding response OmpR family regulator